MLINDLSYLDPEEARQRLHYLALKLWYEQYKANFFIKDVRSDVYLRNEIRAFLEGRIQEFHGWTDILGQMVDAVGSTIGGALSSFYDSAIKPAIDTVNSNLGGVFDTISSSIGDVWNKIVEFGSSISDIYGYLQEAVSPYLEQISNIVNNISDIVSGVVNDALAGVYDSLSAFSDTILSGISGIADMLNNILAGPWNALVEMISGGFESVLKGLLALPEAIAAAFQSALSYIWDLILGARVQLDKVGGTLTETIIEPIWKSLSWVYEWIRDQVSGFINLIYSTVLTRVEALKAGDISSAFELIGTPVLTGASIAGLMSVLGTKVLGTGIEVGEIGEYINRVMSPDTFINALLEPLLSVGVRTPLYQLFNKQFRTRIPEIWDAIRMYWRGKITENELRDIISRYGYSDKFLAGFLDFTNQIPGASDLVRFVVREVFPLESLPPAPSEFAKYMQMQGYNELWSRAYWEAHWELPSFSSLVEAYHRGILNLTELRKYIEWHDYKPTPRPGISKSDVDIMNALIYKLPDKLDARWMLRWGIISKEEFLSIIKAEGYSPDWLTRVFWGEYYNMLLDERTAVKSAVQSLYILGAITEEVLRSILKDIRFLDDEINYLVQASNYKLRKEQIEDAISALKYAYRYDKITIEQLAEQLSNLGLSDDAVQRIVAIELARARETIYQTTEEQVRASGYSVVIRRFKEGLITESELEQELKLLGYTDPRIQQLKLIALLERDYDFAMTALSALKSAYLKRKIGDDYFIREMRRFGFTDEKIALELYLLRLKLGLGFGEEVE